MARRPVVTPTVLDRAIAMVSPRAAARRLIGRWQFQSLAGGGGYKGASRSRRSIKQWMPGGASADGDILPDLPLLRERSRDLERNNPLAGGAINTVTTAVVGSGLRVRPQIDGEALGLDDDTTEDLNRQAEALFRMAADTREIDLTRTQTFGELQALWFRSAKVSGDVFVVKRFVERPGSPLALKLQTVEADRVSNPDNRRDTDTLAAGIEFDRHGAPVACHIRDVHPGDGRKITSKGKWARVPMFGQQTGLPNVLHIFRRERPGQTRGVPYLAPVIEALKQLGDFTEAELDAAVVASFYTVFVKTESGDADIAPMEPTDSVGGTVSDDDYKLGKGAMVGLAPGEDISTAQPGRPNDAFDPFFQAVARQIGVRLELPFELLIKHFTASYTAARAAILEAWRFFRRERADFVGQGCQPVYEAILVEGVARGLIDMPGFFDDPAKYYAYTRAEWHGPPAPQVDPKKEADAAVIFEDRGWKTAAQNTTELTGGDWDRNIARRKKEIAAKKDAGLSATAPDTASAGQGSGQGTGQADQQPPDPPPNPDQPENETEQPS